MVKVAGDECCDAVVMTLRMQMSAAVTIMMAQMVAMNVDLMREGSVVAALLAHASSVNMRSWCCSL